MPAGLRVSRIEARLESQIASAASDFDADCRRAELAAYRARLGRFEQAREQAAALRGRYRARPNATISSWLHLLDGLTSHFSKTGSPARDSFLRARALSLAAGLTRIQALSAAWLAHLDYLRLDVPSMALHSREALRIAANDDHAARARAGLVLAQAFHLASRIDVATHWYESVRRHAMAEDDQATLGALMHNMSWLRAQQIRVSEWKNHAPTADEQHALLGAQSTANLDLMTGTTSLAALVPMLRAQIFTAGGHYAEALALYESDLEAALGQGMQRLQADLVADRAWCRAQLGQHAGALADADAAERCIDPKGQFDDRALAHRRLAQVHAALGDAANARRHDALAQQAWTGHVAVQRHILEALTGLEAPVA